MPTDYGPSGSNAAPSTSALRTGPGASSDRSVFGECGDVCPVLEAQRLAYERIRPEAAKSEPTIEQRLRWSLERYGRHDSGCEAAAPFFPGRCVCGFHKALAQFAGASDVREAE